MPTDEDLQTLFERTQRGDEPLLALVEAIAHSRGVSVVEALFGTPKNAINAQKARQLLKAAQYAASRSDPDYS